MPRFHFGFSQTEHLPVLGDVPAPSSVPGLPGLELMMAQGTPPSSLSPHLMQEALSFEAVARIWTFRFVSLWQRTGEVLGQQRTD